MKRTLATIVVTSVGLASVSVAGSLADTPFTASGSLSAGASSAFFDVLLPSFDNHSVQDPAANCDADISVFADAVDTMLQSGITFTGAGVAPQGSSVGYYITLDLFETTFFSLEGEFSGLTGIDFGFAAASNPFVLHETLSRTQNGFEGSLVDGMGQPLGAYSMSGWIEAGQYDLWVEFSVSGLNDEPYSGSGGLTLTLTTVPSPSSLLAVALPGVLALRRRR